MTTCIDKILMPAGLRFRATFILALAFLGLHSQVSLTVHLTDGNKKPVPSATIIYGTSTFYSDKSGTFRIQNYRPGTKIDIHKFNFADTTISFATTPATTDSLNFNIVLRPKINPIQEVVVGASEVQEINPAKAGFVLGYELYGDYIIELLSRDHVLVVDEENKILSRSRPVSGATDVVKHPDGGIHIVTEEAAFRIDSSSGAALKIDTAHINFAQLKRTLQYCDAVTENSLFLRRYKDVNQTVAFFAMDKRNQKRVKLLKEISDIERIRSVQAFANETNGLLYYVASLDEENFAGVMGEDSLLYIVALHREAEEKAAILENIYAPPAYNILKLVNDNLYLFAHDIDSMFVYDLRWNLVRSSRISYHHLKIWAKEIIVNEEKTKAYAKLLSGSKPMLAEINLETGALKLPFLTIASNFPTRMRIRKNILYYMAKQKSGIGLSVYSQDLGSVKPGTQ